MALSRTVAFFERTLARACLKRAQNTFDRALLAPELPGTIAQQRCPGTRARCAAKLQNLDFGKSLAVRTVSGDPVSPKFP